VRYIINEHWPYYAYNELDGNCDWLERKVGHLYLRLANWRQPLTIIDRVGMGRWMVAGCRKARMVEDAQRVEMACVPVDDDYPTLFGHCDNQSVVIFQDIWKQPDQWSHIVKDRRVTISFDLYYCGIVFFDKKRTKQHYIINF
jgi:hypothetical protein